MRIACVNWSRRRVGGIETYLESVLPLLRAEGHDVAFWAEHDAPADRAELRVPAGTVTWCAGTQGLEASLAGLAGWNPAVVFVHGLTDPAIERRIVGLGASAMLAHTYYGTCISGGKTLTFPVPVPCSRVFGPACLAYFYPRRCGGLSPLTLVRDYRRQSGRLTLAHRYDRVLTLSEHMRAEYVRHGLEPAKVCRLPPYHPGAAPRAARVARPDAPAMLLYLGRLDRLKGCRLLIEALPAIARGLGRPVDLVVAGDGPDRRGCEAIASRVRRPGSIDATFRNWVDEAERSQLLADADALVLPSIWPEPYGLAGLEALSAGVPVAAFQSGGVGEWLRDGVNGALAPMPPSAASLAAAVVRAVGIGRFAPAGADLAVRQQREHVRALAAHLEQAAERGARSAAPAGS